MDDEEERVPKVNVGLALGAVAAADDDADSTVEWNEIKDSVDLDKLSAMFDRTELDEGEDGGENGGEEPVADEGATLEVAAAGGGAGGGSVPAVADEVME